MNMMNSVKGNEKIIKIYNKSTENKSTFYLNFWGGYFQLNYFIDNVGKHKLIWEKVLISLHFPCLRFFSFNFYFFLKSFTVCLFEIISINVSFYVHILFQRLCSDFCSKVQCWHFMKTLFLVRNSSNLYETLFAPISCA